MTPKQAWTEGYRAQTNGAKVFDNPETGRCRVRWFDGYATAERETFVLKGISKNPIEPLDWRKGRTDSGDMV